MVNVIRELLLKVVKDIDDGNCDLTSSECMEVIDMLKKYTDNLLLYNRTLAAKYLHCSILSFDLYRKEGKLLEGKKVAGGVMLWTKNLLDEFIKKYRK